MDRLLMREMVAWKESSGRMPMLIDGARQVGKTWLMREFGQNHFSDHAYINLENNPVMEQVFSSYSDTSQIIRAIEAFVRKDIIPNRTLIILDEIQEVPHALSSLKYFCENAPEYPVVAAGSLLGIKFPKQQAPYPVGKIQTLKLHPLSFTEYLLAVGEEQLVEVLQSSDFNLISALSTRFAGHLGDYYFVGGMPGVVSAFVEHSNYQRARAVQLQIIEDMQNDMSKHLPPEQASRAHTIWQSIPSQLGKEQGKRFYFSELSRSKRASEFKDALQWLVDARLVTKVQRVSKPGIPLKYYASDELFELYMLDVGLFSAMTELDVNSVLMRNPLFAEGRGALSEQYVCQQLIAEAGVTPYYWAAERSQAQLDFITSHEGRVYPIEVKATVNLKSKSLRRFCEEHNLHGYRLSMADFKQQDWMTNIPLYAVSQLFRDSRQLYTPR